MAKIDEIKEKISLYKFFLGLISAMIFSIIGFVIENYSNIKISLFIISIIVLIILIYLFSIFVYIIIKHIKELKDM